MNLSGSYKINSNKVVLQTDTHTKQYDALSYKKVLIPLTSSSASVRTDGRGGILLHLTRYAVHALVATKINGVVYWDEYAFRLMRRVKQYTTINPKIYTVEAGFTLYFHSDGTISKKDVAPYLSPVVRIGETFDQAVNGLKSVLLEAAKDMYETLGEPKCTILLSGGTDSTLCACILKEIGADIRAVSVGIEPDDFDPKYAADYCKQLGIPFDFVQLPSTREGMAKLLHDTIEVTEQCEMSNTLMAMCKYIAAEHADSTGYNTLVNGIYADTVLGYLKAVSGGFNKIAHENPSQEWANTRAKLVQHTIPGHLRVARVSKFIPNMRWFGLYYHPAVTKYLLETSIEHIPPGDDKKIMQVLCDRYIENGAWHFKNKIGFYTGAGIGKWAAKNPDILGDKAMRNAYAQIMDGYRHPKTATKKKLN